jgi:hypothetical protein
MREERPATAGNSWIPLRDGQQQVARMQRQRNAGKMLGHGVDPRIPLRDGQDARVPRSAWMRESGLHPGYTLYR